MWGGVAASEEQAAARNASVGKNFTSYSIYRFVAQKPGYGADFA